MASSEQRQESFMNRDADTLVQDLAAALCAQKATLSVAESCTGGLLGATCTHLAGSSQWFVGGTIAYSNDVKHVQLGVPNEWIDQAGAVSETVACGMADGVRQRFESAVGVGITGIAGPDGGSPDKPVGLVWIAVASSTGIIANAHHFNGDRRAVREQAVIAALTHLIQHVGA
jgi:nicotinamide-nucleotide amidase